MVGFTLLLTLLPAWAACSGEGNIRLLHDEVAVALKACANPNDARESTNPRQRRSDDSYNTAPRIDDDIKQVNTYSHERRNSNDTQDQVQVVNATDYDYEGYDSGNKGDNPLNIIPRPAIDNQNGNIDNINRTKRNEPLFNKADNDQCLSQCVFANLQVVDSRGIPREAELWNKVQTAVTSQQSRAALRDQIRACFQELQSEAEDNGCSYSNKLERCLMLRFSDRRPDTTEKSQNQGNEEKPTA